MSVSNGNQKDERPSLSTQPVLGTLAFVSYPNPNSDNGVVLGKSKESKKCLSNVHGICVERLVRGKTVPLSRKYNIPADPITMLSPFDAVRIVSTFDTSERDPSTLL
jgi:hypothetical protein